MFKGFCVAIRPQFGMFVHALLSDIVTKILQFFIYLSHKLVIFSNFHVPIDHNKWASLKVIVNMPEVTCTINTHETKNF